MSFQYLLLTCLILSVAVSLPCDDGTYDNGSGICIKCPQLCKKCTDTNTCTECDTGTSTYKGLCVSECPAHSKLQTSDCVLDCPNDNEYPEYKNNIEFTCKAVPNELSPYCIQQIPNLQYDKKGFSFQIVNPTDKVNLNLKVLFFNTPSICYTNNLNLGTETINPISPPKQINGALEILYQFPIADMDPLKNPSCKDEECTFTDKLLWKGMLQFTYTFKVKIVNSAVILNDDIKITGDGNTSTPVCVGCEVPKELKLLATLSIECKQTTDCAQSGTIKAVAGERVLITQKLEDKYSLNTIKPHSIVLKIKDDGGVDVGSFQITNYESKSDVPGQITYEFATVGFKSGTLIVTSKIDHVIFKTRLLSSHLRSLEQTANTKYPYQEIKVDVTSDSDSTVSNQLAIGLVVGIVVAIAIALIAFFILGLYILKRRKYKMAVDAAAVAAASSNNEESVQHMNEVKQIQDKTPRIESN